MTINGCDRDAVEYFMRTEMTPKDEKEHILKPVHLVDADKVRDWKQEMLNKWLALDIEIPDDLPGDPYDAAYEMRSKCLLAIKELIVQLPSILPEPKD